MCANRVRRDLRSNLLERSVRSSIAVTLKTRFASVISLSSSSRPRSLRCNARSKCSTEESGVCSSLTLSDRDCFHSSQAAAVSGSRCATIRSDNGLSNVLSCRVGACSESNGNDFERMGIESSSIRELRRHSAPSAIESPRSNEPSVSPVSRSLTAIIANAPSAADSRRILSLRALSLRVFSILSTPGYASIDLCPPSRNLSRSRADILANVAARLVGIRSAVSTAYAAMATS